VLLTRRSLPPPASYSLRGRAFGLPRACLLRKWMLYLLAWHACILACIRGIHACVHLHASLACSPYSRTCIHTYTHTHTHTHTGASTESTHTLTHTHTHECNGDEYMNSCADTLPRAHTYIHARAHTYIHACIHAPHTNTHTRRETNQITPPPSPPPNTQTHKHTNTHTRGGRGTGKRALYGRLSGGETAAQRAQGQGALQPLFTLCHAQRPLALGNPGSPSSMHARK
jgi:hypothetical protein